MKKGLLICSLVLFAFVSSGQKEGYVWYFGYHAGLDFNSGAPVPLANGAINTTEGCASIADSGGKLLFYTDGYFVWNKNHQQMPNGTGLDGGASSTQSALIVKAPGSNTLYYIFTVAESQGANGFRYSTVDMTQQSGLGDVVLKNIAVQTNTAEKLCGVRHANGTDIWIMVHSLNSDGFYAYLLTSAGFNITPVISNVGSVHGLSSGDEIGYMKFSPDGRKLACAVRYQYFYELFDFNNATGIVTNPIHFNSTALTYGVEFSPDNTKLYLEDSYSSSFSLWQVDLSSNDSATIAASKTGITTIGIWAIQLAPDGKIYIAMYTNTLSVINNPNALGLACGFVANSINLGAASSNLGMPNFVSSYVSSSVPPPIAALQSSDSTFCENNCISFTDRSISNPTSWLWTFQGGLPPSSSEQNPSLVCYPSAGSYAVTLVASNSGGSNTATYSNFINVITAPPTPTITQTDTILYCSTDTSYSSYQWYADTTLIPGATDSFLVVKQSGNYNVQVRNSNGCGIAVGINIVLGLENNLSMNTISLYPNPSENEFTVYGLRFTRPATITIYNVLGEETSPPTPLREERGETMIDIRGLAAGIYFVKVADEKDLWVGRFVKE